MGTEFDHDFAKSVNEKTIDASNMVLKTLILVHGGSAVALLAFIGNLSNKVSPEKVSQIAMTLVWFGWGMVIALAAMILAYFTHYLTVGYTYSGIPKNVSRYALWKAIFHIFASLAVVGSIIAFICGMYRVRDAVLFVFVA